MQPGKRSKTAQGSKKRFKKSPQGLTPYSRRSSVFTPRTSPIPPQYMATLRYAETVTLTLSSGAFNSYVFVCNGLYDPNLTGTGHQPLLFDQIMALYTHYHVKKSRCYISACLPNAIDCGITQALVVEDNSSLATSSVGGMTEMQGQRGGMPCVNTQAASLPKMYASWNAKEVFGGDLLANNALRGNVGANPSEASYFIYGAQDNNGSTLTLVLAVVIEYDCVFTEFKGVAQS